jgi:hypothetical protein
MANYSASQLRALASSVLPGATSTQLDMAVAIALAESRGNPSAVSSTGDYGLWQVNARSWPQFTTSQLLDPLGNAKAMAHISKGGTDWGPWVSFGTSAYRNFLPGSTHPEAMQMGIGIPGTPWEIPTPGDVAGAVGGAASDVLADIVEPLVSRASVAALALILTTTGLALFALGLSRLSANSQTTRNIVTAATAATGAGGTIAAIA